jgi:hypothetical protein
MPRNQIHCENNFSKKATTWMERTTGYCMKLYGLTAEEIKIVEGAS